MIQDPLTRPYFEWCKDMDDSTLSVLIMLDKMWGEHDTKEFIELENWILDVMACFLKRKIVLKPLFQKSPLKRL